MIINHVQKSIRASLVNIIKPGVDKDHISKITQNCLESLKNQNVIEDYVLNNISVEIIGENDSPEEIIVREIMEEENDKINIKCTIAPVYPADYIKIDLKI
jgi:hypothetical protein